jgi:hypothetical protein
MMLIEGSKSFYVTTQASIVDPSTFDGRELAWAERSVKANPAFKWILGKYVQADSANSNGHYWAFDDLKAAQSTINHAPLNILHRPNYIVGHFVDNEMMYQTDLSATNDTPYIEALSVFYKYYFPEEFMAVQNAYDQGMLFYSMECVAETITCWGDGACGLEFAYKGPKSDTYCAHLQQPRSVKKLNNPHFLAGALVLPPAKPGWSGAEVKEISELVATEVEMADQIYSALTMESENVDPSKWELAMALILNHVKASDAS